MRTNIIVKFDLEGRHRWNNAPDEYAYLRNEHEHIFHFEAHIPITESRQIEFLEARRELIRIVKVSYGNEPCDFRGMSCEQLAQSVWRSIVNKYSVEPIVVSVCEDHFVGAEIHGD